MPQYRPISNFDHRLRQIVWHPAKSRSHSAAEQYDFHTKLLYLRRPASFPGALCCCLIPSNFFLTTNRIRGLGILLTQSFTLVKLKAPANLNSGKKPYWRFLWTERYKQSTKAFSGSAMRKFPSARYQSNPAKKRGQSDEDEKPPNAVRNVAGWAVEASVIICGICSTMPWRWSALKKET